MAAYRLTARLLALMILVFFLPCPSKGEEPATAPCLGLKDCIKLALETDPDVLEARDSIALSQVIEQEAKKDLILPIINLETTYGPKLDYFGRPIVNENIYFSMIRVEKPIYKGGQLIAAYRMGQTEKERASYQYLEKAIQVTYKTVEAYYKVLLAQKKARYYKDLYNESLKMLEFFKRKYVAGGALRLDVLEAKTRCADMRYRLTTAQGELERAIANLNERIGRRPDTRIQVKDELPIVPPEEEDLNGFIAGALENRPDILYQKRDVDYKKWRLKMSKGRNLPTISLVGSYSWEGEDFPGQEKEWMVGLKVSFLFGDVKASSSLARNNLMENPYNFVRRETDFDVASLKLSFFDGSSNRVSCERAQKDYRYARNLLDKKEKEARKELREAVSSFKEAKALVETAKSSLDFARERLEIIVEKAGLGEAKTLDLFDARMKLVEAKLRYASSRYGYEVSAARLYQVTGKKLRWREKSE